MVQLDFRISTSIPSHVSETLDASNIVGDYATIRAMTGYETLLTFTLSSLGAVGSIASIVALIREINTKNKKSNVASRVVVLVPTTGQSAKIEINDPEQIERILKSIGYDDEA